MKHKKLMIMLLPLLLLTSCEERSFVMGSDAVYLPEPTKISFTNEAGNSIVLKEEATKTFYDTYLKDLKFVRSNEIFDSTFTFFYSYEFSNYKFGDEALEFRLADFNYLCFIYTYRALDYSYVYEEQVPYLEMRNFLFENSLVVPE